MVPSLHQENFSNHLSDELLVARIVQIHASMSKLDSLKPSKQMNSLLIQLKHLCTLPTSIIDVFGLPKDVQAMRESLIRLCGQAEGLFELEYATALTKIPNPMQNLDLFPDYENYVKLVYREYKIIKENGVVQPKKLAFVGSGPMPLTSIVLAMNHLKTTVFDNYDIEEAANDLASRIVSSDDDLQRRMRFITRDVMDVKEEFGEYDCVFLASLVGMTKQEKVNIIAHLGKYMKKRELSGIRWLRRTI